MPARLAVNLALLALAFVAAAIAAGGCGDEEAPDATATVQPAASSPVAEVSPTPPSPTVRPTVPPEPTRTLIGGDVCKPPREVQGTGI